MQGFHPLLLTNYRYIDINMSVRVVARIRPLLKNEIDKDIIVTAAPASTGTAQLVRIPNPKQPAELYSFQFNSVYEQETTQQELFDNEGMSNGAQLELRVFVYTKQYRQRSNTSSKVSMSHSSHMESRVRARRIPCAVGSLWQTEVLFPGC